MHRVCSFTLILAGLMAIQGRADEDKDVKTDKDVTITDKADKTRVKLAKGNLLIVKLPGNPTTGFQWVVAKSNKDELAPQGKSEYVANKQVPPVVGGGGTFVFKFKAEKAGTSPLELEYKRPFEKDKAAAKTFKVDVVIE
jgi:inhibitor of cysteine peptidase